MTDIEADPFISALVAMQADLPVITKNAENPHFKSRFADLATIVQETRPILAKHGFAVAQLPGFNEAGDPTLTTVLYHTSGGTIRTEMLLGISPTAGPQVQGSALTYAKRYSLSAILGLVTEDDDDGNAAQTSAPPAATQRRSSPVSRPVEGGAVAQELDKEF